MQLLLLLFFASSTLRYTFFLPQGPTWWWGLDGTPTSNLDHQKAKKYGEAHKLKPLNGRKI